LIRLIYESVFTKYSQKLETVESDEEARKYGFKKGPFKLLKRDFVLLTTEEAKKAREKVTEAFALKEEEFKKLIS